MPEVPRNRLIGALEKLASVNPPRNRLYLDKLRKELERMDSIPASHIICRLVCAGYTIHDIIDYLVEAGVVASADDLAGYKLQLRNLVEAGCGCG